MLIDEVAKEVATTRFALPPCLHVPVAARSQAAIEKYIGRTSWPTKSTPQGRAFVVELSAVPTPDLRLPIWRLQGASILHARRQLWVHVDYSAYRKAYRQAFPAEEVTDLVLDHVMNRRVARLKGFPYLRIVPVSRGANSSSGGLSEKWAVAYHSTPAAVRRNRETRAQIQYADLADIVKMLDLKTGGALQDPVNDAQVLIVPE